MYLIYLLAGFKAHTFLGGKLFRIASFLDSGYCRRKPLQGGATDNVNEQ
jgi:hypothetical protein